MPPRSTASGLCQEYNEARLHSRLAHLMPAGFEGDWLARQLSVQVPRGAEQLDPQRSKEGNRPVNTLRGFDRTFYTALAVASVGILGLAVTTPGLLGVSNVPARAPLWYWGLAAISIAFSIIGTIWLFVLRARFRRDIVGR